MPALVPAGEKIAVLALMSRPAGSSNGPRELPEPMAVSVWITSAISRPPLVGRRRLSRVPGADERHNVCLLARNNGEASRAAVAPAAAARA
jgi:hypothetical protein